MSLVLLEGFESDRSDTYLDLKYGAFVWTATSGYQGGRGIRGHSSLQWITFHSQAGQENSWVVGLNFCGVSNSFPDGGIRFRTGGNVQFTINFERSPGVSTMDTKITLTDGTTVYEVTQWLLDQRWYYLEFVVTVRDGVNGSFEVWIDGVQVLSQSGIDTAQQGTDGADEVQIATSTHITYDNIYILTGTGTPNTRLGPQYVTGLLANGDSSNENEWTAAGGGTKFSKIDDDPALALSTADRITADAANLKQLFTWQNMNQGTVIPHTGVSITALQVSNYGAMDGSGTRNVAVRFKDTSNPTPVNGSAWSVVGTTQQFHQQHWSSNPVTALAFSYSEIDAMEVGVATLT